jgi:hypothetical protein
MVEIRIPDYLMNDFEIPSLFAAADDSDQITCDVYGCSSDSGCSADGTCEAYSCGLDGGCSSDGGCTSYTITYPTYSLIEVTSNSATVHVNVSPDFDYYRVFCRLSSDPSDVTYDTGMFYATSSFNHTIVGLDPSTSYIANVGYGIDASGSTWIGRTTFSTGGSVEPWSWYSSNGSASDTLTQQAYNAVVNNQNVKNFNYLVWNDLVNKINEAAYAAGYAWDTYYASLSSTLMTSSSKTLTAIRYNSARYNIGIHYSTGISTVYSGNDVIGSTHFLNLVTKLNEWISTI